MVFLIFVKTLKDKIMQKQLYLTTVLLLIILFYSSCNTCPPSDEGSTYNVNTDDLPYIIPYTETSKVRFLKNGKDTITFISQGLKKTYIKQGVANGNCEGTDKLQQYSLRMAGNDEFFETMYGGTPNFQSIGVSVTINGIIFNDIPYAGFIKYYPPVLSYKVLNIKYDSVTLLTSKYKDTLYYKPKYGFIYFKTSGNNTYQLIDK
jgi:hypothetical protein